jgi:hypothetical protein
MNLDKKIILPSILILIDIGAAIPYFISGDIKHGIYWLAAATLTACVTY